MGSFLRSGLRKSRNKPVERIYDREIGSTMKHVQRVNQVMNAIYWEVIDMFVNNKDKIVDYFERDKDKHLFMAKVVYQLNETLSFKLDNSHLDIVAGNVYIKLEEMKII